MSTTSEGEIAASNELLSSEAWSQTPQLSVASAIRSVSPPSKPRSLGAFPSTRKFLDVNSATTADVEARKVEIGDHLQFFAEKLLKQTLAITFGECRLSHRAWLDLYDRNQLARGGIILSFTSMIIL